jgi:hypothetical protein
MAAIGFAVVTAACGQTDAGVTTKIKSKFAADDLVKAHEINVTTQDHIVTLSGNVENAAAKQQAVRLARETEGVRDVIDDLRVDTAATTGDHDITIDVDDDVERGARSTGNAIERGAEATGDAVKKGAEATADAAKKAGRAVRDAVTDNDRDSDNDGK